jgi:Outer membrane protein
LEALDETQNLLLSNTVGSASLLELSAEYRYRFPKPAGWDSFWASLVERSGLTVFTDIGNAFNRLTTGKYGTMRLRDLWEGSVIAMGIGYRFDTPVGPFRFDYATSIYDPLRKDGKWIFSGREHPFSLSNWHISIGLGHPF